MSEKYLMENIGSDNVKISDDVIATIASVAAENVDGIVKMQSNLKSQVSDMFSNKAQTRGVKVSIGESQALIDIYITVEYGKKIVEVSKIVQKKVKEAIENMTGLNVAQVNVHVSGISTTAVKN